MLGPIKNVWAESVEVYDRMSVRQVRDANSRLFFIFVVLAVTLGLIPDFYHNAAVYWTVQFIAFMLLLIAIRCALNYSYFRGYHNGTMQSLI